MAKKITDEMLETAFDLASRGAGRSMIGEALGIHPRSTYRGKLGESIKSGYKIAKSSILNSYLTMAEIEPKLLEKLADRLGVFRQIVDIDTPEDVKELPGFLRRAIELYNDGDISKLQLEALQHWADKYVNASKAAELDELVEELLERIEALEGKNGKR